MIYIPCRRHDVQFICPIAVSSPLACKMRFSVTLCTQFSATTHNSEIIGGFRGCVSEMPREWSAIREQQSREWKQTNHIDAKRFVGKTKKQTKSSRSVRSLRFLQSDLIFVASKRTHIRVKKKWENKKHAIVVSCGVVEIFLPVVVAMNTLYAYIGIARDRRRRRRVCDWI